MSQNCRNFISRLLEKSPALRLGSTNDAEDVKSHPFFADVDFDALLRFETTPPFAPPRRGPVNGDDISAGDAQHAEREVQRKLTGTHKPINRQVAKAVKARGKHLDEGEYKPVSITPPNGEEEKERRISIGLDWRARNAEAGTKTWTGTTDDFGRKV